MSFENHDSTLFRPTGGGRRERSDGARLWDSGAGELQADAGDGGDHL